MKKFFNEFKTFIKRGNVVDLAVGVIIGGAFSAIVTALTNNILMPIINWVLLAITGGKGLEEIYTYLNKVGAVDVEGNPVIVDGKPVIDLESSIYIDWGAFITAIINFILIALVVFLIVKAINRMNEGAAARKNRFVPLTKDEVKKLRAEGKDEKEILAIAEARKAAEEEAAKKAAEEAAANAPETEQQLLCEIRDLLKSQKPAD